MNYFMLLLIISIIWTGLNASGNEFEIVVKPSLTSLSTDSIQKAINLCYQNGGGIVKLTEGIYRSGSIELKNNVKLFIGKGVILQGSDKYSDYHNDAFIFGKDLKNISIIGEGVIDGVDCINPKGEEGFRGPHCIRFVNCDGIILRGISIERSANWAINCRYCKNSIVEKVNIRGGHDGLHTRFCEKFTVKNCDFRTGDDCFAGNDNRDFVITDCLVNTSCSGFRFGCLNLRLEHCKIWGPGEYAHRIRKERRMPVAFVHFSPNDESVKLPSANWVVRDIEADSVKYFYVYNHVNGLWQSGQPAYNISFENVKARNIQDAFYIVDKNHKFSLTVSNSSFKFLEGSEYNPAHFEGVPFRSYDFLYAENFDAITLNKVTFEKKDTASVLTFISGNILNINDINLNSPCNRKPFIIEKVKQQSASLLMVNGKQATIKSNKSK